VNLKSVLFPCKHALPVMRAQRAGAIVNVSSGSALASTEAVAYKVSKAGVNAFTQSLAIANAKYGVRANTVMPGMIDTPMASVGLGRSLGLDPAELRRRRDAMVPLRGRQGTAWDVAHAALFLASDEARFITGAVLPVDGGVCARVGVEPI
jgi:NAD(P)-dependent dehydrogenase (short-subunit alcohol dehydrogenase family)